MTLSQFDRHTFPRAPMNGITPFTYRDGATYLEILEQLRTRLDDVIQLSNENVEALDEMFALTRLEITNELDEAKQEVALSALAAKASELIALEAQRIALEQVAVFIAPAKEVVDLINSQLVTDAPSTLTKTALDTAYVNASTLSFDVMDYGGNRDPDVDNSVAFTATVAAAKAAGGRAFASGAFRVNEGFTIDCNADFGDAAIDFYGTGVAVNITGARLSVVAPRVVNKMKEFPTSGGWAAVGGSVGVRLFNTLGCTIEVPFVQNFETGLLCMGSNTGCAYNTVTVGWLFNNKRNQVLDTFSSGTGTGYSNQNTYLGGRLSHHAGEGTNVPGIVSLLSVSTGDGGPNNNVWINTCFEGSQPQYSIDLQNARYNVFLNPRLEYANAIRFGANANRNSFLGGYGMTTVSIVRETGEAVNSIEHARERITYDQAFSMWRAGQEFPWIKFDDLTRKFSIGNGVTAPADIRSVGANLLEIDASLRPATTNLNDLGSPTYRWRNFVGSGYLAGASFDSAAVVTPSAINGTARVFTRLNAGSKHELCVRFPTGLSQVIATEA